MRHYLTLSVIPSNSIIIRSTPISTNHHGIDNPRQIRHAHTLQLPSLGITTHPKLDPQLQLRRQPSLLNPRHQPHLVFQRQRQEPGTDLDGIEPERPALCQISIHDHRRRAAPARAGQHVLDPTARADVDTVRVREVDQLAQRGLWKEREGAAGEFEAVDVRVHGLQHAGEVAWPHGAVVGTPDLGHADAARFWGARVVPDEAEAVVGVSEEGFWGWL